MNYEQQVRAHISQYRQRNPVSLWWIVVLLGGASIAAAAGWAWFGSYPYGGAQGGSAIGKG